MDYNTQRKQLVLPEYGRNLQNMVDHIKTLETKEERNKAAKSLIGVMGNLNPHLRDVSDFKHKLWDHLFIMADFDLDVDCPYPIITRHTLTQKPKRLPYKPHNLKYKHYGRIIQDMIQEAILLEPGDEKEALIMLIANHMKKNYITWNKDAIIDEEIYKDVEEMSKGLLIPDRSNKLAEIREPRPQQQQNYPKKSIKKKGRR
ncbi:MAG: DUF4290 domain-containing protein [Bacteroidales bacterium]|nr:DUF4290 domain-containing protein [Bacteroidales bacterium]